MTLNNRRFSLDSLQAPLLERDERIGSGRFRGKKSSKSESLDDARLEIQALNHSLNSNKSLRDQTIAEEQHDRPDGLLTNSSLPQRPNTEPKSFQKHNKSFHKLFPDISEDEELTHSFTCALQKEIPYHGKLFVTEKHVCFHSSVLLKDTRVVLTVCAVSEVKKHNTALSKLTITSKFGDKYSLVSLRNREMCYKLLQNICYYAKCGSSSPHVSDAENEADPVAASSHSSLEDNSVDTHLTRQSSVQLDEDFPHMSSEGPTRSNSSRHSSLKDEDPGTVSWKERLMERLQPLFFLLRGVLNLSAFFYVYMMLMVLILVLSGYIGMRMVALEERLNTLGSFTEMFKGKELAKR